MTITNANITLPAPTLLAGSDGIVETLPMYVLDTGATVDAQPLTMYTLASEATLVANLASNTLPAYTLASDVLVGRVGTFAGTLPAPTLAAGSNGAALSLPAPTLSAQGLAGQHASAGLRLPAPTLSASMLTSRVVTADLTVAAMRLTATVISENRFSFAGTLPSLHATATSLTGRAGSLDDELPAFTLASVVHGPYIGTASMALPAFVLESTALAEATEAFRTWVLNTRKKALTEYDNFSFNSYARFRGVVLAAGPDGLFKLTGENLDNDTGITARARTGKEDFGTSHNKRVPRIYVSYENGGDLHFKTLTTHGGTRVYLLSDNGAPGLQQRRVPVGRGPKSPYWQFEVENVEGSDFLIAHMQVYPEGSRRRVV